MKANNHYVPIMYQKRWSIDGYKIFVYRLIVSNPKVPLWSKESMKHNAMINGLYIYMDHGNESDSIEEAYDALVESPTDGIIEKICNNENVSTDDWEQLILFVLAQYVRTPAFLGWIKRYGIEVVQRNCNKLAETIASSRCNTKICINNDEKNRLNPISVEIISESNEVLLASGDMNH